jgi:hypothetical protein
MIRMASRLQNRIVRIVLAIASECWGKFLFSCFNLPGVLTLQKFFLPRPRRGAGERIKQFPKLWGMGAMPTTAARRHIECFSPYHFPLNLPLTWEDNFAKSQVRWIDFGQIGQWMADAAVSTVVHFVWRTVLCGVFVVDDRPRVSAVPFSQS